jgi:hypothetical protein
MILLVFLVSVQIPIPPNVPPDNFLSCTNNCSKVYTEMPRPPGMSALDIPDEAMLKICLDNNKGDRSFDNPVTNPQGIKVKITPTACVLGNAPPPGTSPANAFAGYN